MRNMENSEKFAPYLPMGGGALRISNIFIIFIILLVTSVGCQNRVIIIPTDPLYPSTSDNLSFTEAVKYVDEGKVLVDALNAAPGTSYETSEQQFLKTGAMYLAEQVEPAEKTVYVRVSFTGGYDNGLCYINEGYIDYTLYKVKVGADIQSAILNDVVEYTAEASKISVTTDSADNSVVMDAHGLAGEIKKISVGSANDGKIGFTLDENTTTISSTTQGIFTSGNESVSVAETEGIVSGGTGIETDPYMISTTEQFLKISNLCENNMEAPLYFELASDISITQGDYIDQFVGVLDGGETRHSIRVSASNDEDAAPFVVRATGKYAEFRNIDFYTEGGVALVYGDELVDSTGKIILDTEFLGFYDINIYGVAEDVGTNMGFLLVYGEADELVFDRCVNYASMYGSMNAYSSPFLGYLVAGKDSGMQTSKLTFDSCENYGDFIMGKAGFLVANGGNVGNFVPRYVLGETETPKEGQIQLIVKNLKNGGKIVGYDGNAGWFTWNANDPKGHPWATVNEYVESNLTNSGSIGTTGIDGLELSATENSDGKVVLSATVNGGNIPSNYTAVYQRSFYGSYTKPTGESAGTLRTVDVVNPANAGSKIVTINDLHDFVANGQVMIPVAPNGTWEYSVTLYDASTGYPAGGAKARVQNT